MKQFKVEIPAGNAQQWQMTQYLLSKANEKGRVTTLRAENSQSLVVNILVPLIPWLLIFGFVWFFVFRQLRNSAGAGGMLGNFGKSKTQLPTVNFGSTPVTAKCDKTLKTGCISAASDKSITVKAPTGPTGAQAITLTTIAGATAP